MGRNFGKVGRVGRQGPGSTAPAAGRTGRAGVGLEAGRALGGGGNGRHGGTACRADYMPGVG